MFGLNKKRADKPDETVLSPRQVLTRAKKLRTLATELLDEYRITAATAQTAYDAERARLVKEQLHKLPLSKLKQALEGSVRLKPVEVAGFATVGAVLDAGISRLERIPGVGGTTSRQLIAAADKVKTALGTSIRVRFEVDRRPNEQAMLLKALYRYELPHELIEPLHQKLEAAVALIDVHIDVARLANRPIRRLFTRAKRKTESRHAFDQLAAWIVDPATKSLAIEIKAAKQRISRTSPPKKPWEDYIARPVLYNGLLINISGKNQNELSANSFLSNELAEQVRSFDLDTSLLRVSLRGYQAFGAKFALLQGRVILGDEMGLGKTIEALAVLTHLRAQGETHFLVVSPASVMVNWEQEITKHTRIERTWRLHGPDRNRCCRQWARTGGIGLTTFGTLGSLDLHEPHIAAIVVDEAHYIKNPLAKRTQAANLWIKRADRALLMSGTPLENRVEEFRSLVHHIRPDVAATLSATDALADGHAFRQAVAPVYLRRNQDDVLDELPDRIETDEWLPLGKHAAEIYREGVADRNMMLMRRAAFLTERPRDSQKLTRLLEIVEEAEANNRKVVVFSFFHEVIERVLAAVGPLASGPLTGSVPANQRQQLIESFSKRKGPAVLVSQIEAGGVGLNIQAASVVILTEPQWKPSTENQAISRCHRMGQVRPVEVHRLLTTDSVDVHIKNTLTHKSALHDEYARMSETKEGSPEATDKTCADISFDLGRQADCERQIIELERRRLGLDDAVPLVPRHSDRGGQMPHY